MFLAANVGSYPSGRGPYDDFWYSPVPSRTGTGARIDEDRAMRLAILYACVNLISQDFAKVPLFMFRRKPNGSRERVQDHPIIKLLYKPTKLLTGIEWKQRLQAHQLLRGNGYSEIRTDYRGRVTALEPFKPDTMRPEVMLDGSVRYIYRDPKSGTEKIYLEGEILHLRGLSLEGPLGLNPIEQMREMLGEAVATQNYGATFFENDARPSVWLEHPSHFKDEGARKDWLAAFRRAFGGANRFSPMMVEYGIKVHDLPAVNHSDLQFIELRKMKGVEICAMYRVPPHKVAILDRSTNNNIEHQGIEYVTDCLSTWCRRWEERLAADLLTDSEREEYYFEFILDALMRGDALSRNDAYKSAILTGWLTRNEVRRRENLEELEGLDDPLQPVNMQSPAAADAAAAALPAGQSAPNPNAPDDNTQGRARELELQARRRVLNRETRALTREWERAAGDVNAFAEGVTDFYAKHLEFVIEALAISHTKATIYCLRQCDAISAAVEKERLPKLFAQWELRAEALAFPNLPTDEDVRGAADAEERETERIRLEAALTIAAAERTRLETMMVALQKALAEAEKSRLDAQTADLMEKIARHKAECERLAVATARLEFEKAAAEKARAEAQAERAEFMKSINAPRTSEITPLYDANGKLIAARRVDRQPGGD